MTIIQIKRGNIISLNNEIEQFLINKGALRVGFATQTTLYGGPPSVDITYSLSEAQSAICFALPLDKKKIRKFLRKDLPDGCKDHELDNIATNIKAYKMAISTSKMLQEKGYQAAAVFPNFKYREEMPGWELKMYPELSLKYIAARSGVGSIGWSGNIGIKGYGTAIILGCLVTSANLEPTDPVPEEESFCTKCKLCQKACALRMFDDENTESITLGGYTFNFSKRRNLARCQVVCGGLTGLEKDGNWSTWSPGRHPYPETDKEVIRLLSLAVTNAMKWPENYIHGQYDTSKLVKDEDLMNALGDQKDKIIKMIKETRLTCGNCQLICWGEPKETKKNYNILINSGCVIQREDGGIEVLPAEQAAEVFDQFPSKHKRKYRRNYKK
ncbi:MAG: hypothetical protein GF383_10030 [Candidatus Lokiarchaeota archaeon]|nr:hypothetical protein [Candidatus Lokiarchaeota archaeon]MBD3340873.1 hypothetical protein [Candidatus Lokiarchaeota archaeon]